MLLGATQSPFCKRLITTPQITLAMVQMVIYVLYFILPALRSLLDLMKHDGSALAHPSAGHFVPVHQGNVIYYTVLQSATTKLSVAQLNPLMCVTLQRAQVKGAFGFSVSLLR
jgi:hypothetical protein